MPDLKEKYTKLANAATRQGMRLEFDACEHLTDYFKSRQIEGVNKINHQFTDIENVMTQIDVYGRYPSSISNPNHTFHFIIECKGMSEDTELLLVEQTNAFYQEYDNEKSLHWIEIVTHPERKLEAVAKENVNINSGFNIAKIPDSSISATTAAFNGCFYQKQGDTYKKVKDQENRTDLLHANLKIQAAANAIIHNLTTLEPDTSNLLIPMIFTNAAICMINYEKNIIYQVPWALHLISLDKGYKDLGYLPYIVICTSRHFAECIGSTPSFAYPVNWDFSPVDIKAE